MSDQPVGSDPLLKGIADASDSLIYATDLDGRFLFANRALEALLGVSVGGLLGATREEFLPAEVCDAHRANDLVVIESGEPLVIEETTEQADGVHVYESVKSPLRDASGRIFAVAGVSTDITERKRAEALVEANETRYRELFERAPMGYQSLDAEGRFIAVNDAWCNVLGYSADEVLGTWFGALLAPPYVEAFRERFPMFKAAGEIHSEFEMIAKSGEHRWIVFEGRIGTNADGSFKQTHCVLRDATDANRALAALSQSEERYRTLVEQASDGIFMADETGRYIEVNTAGCEMLGYSRDELLTMSLAELIAPDDVDAEPLRMSELDAGKVVVSRRHLVRKDGSTLAVEISAHKLPHGRLQGIVRDLTERESALDQLRASQLRLSTLFEASPNAIHVNRLSDGLYLEINAGFTELTGYGPEDVAGKTSLELGAWEHAEDRERLLEALAASGSVRSFRTRFRRKDGSVVPILMSARTVELGGEECALSVSMDVSEVEQARSRIESLNRLYAVLSGINQALVHLRDPEAIFAEACRVIVELGGFSMAWVARVTDDGLSVEPVAEVGASEGYLHDLGIRLGGDEHVEGPVSRAISHGAMVIVQDAEEETTSAAWLNNVRSQGYRSVGTFPLTLNDTVVGALAIYSDRAGIFDDEAVALLEELAGDISFSLELGEKEELRQKAEEALRESERWLTESQRTAHLGHYVYDIEADHWDGSPALYEVLGVAENLDRDFAGWLATVHPLDRESMSKYFAEEVLGKHQPFKREYRLASGSVGDERWVLGLGTVEWSEDGRPLQMFGVIQDITERKHAEQEHQSMLATAMDGFWVSDAEGRLVEVNDAYCKMSGHSASELLSMRVPDLEVNETPDDVDAHAEAIRRAGQMRFESQHRRKDGTIFDVESSVHFRPESGHFGAFQRDITDRKRRERYDGLTREILKVLNRPESTRDSMRDVVSILRRVAGIDAVGIRMADGDDFPYIAHEGFPTDHLLTGDSLVALSSEGAVIRDQLGRAVYECACGLVVSGGSDAMLTPGGSYWTSDSEVLLDLGPDEDPRAYPRNLCILEGFSSIAWVPIRDKERIVGLLHLADRATGVFDRDVVGHLESIAVHIGEAVTRKRAEERLTASLLSITDVVSEVSEARDPYTAGHQRRVSELAVAIAEQMGCSAEQVREVRTASLLHDIGKMSIPAEILSKPGKLTEIEFQLIKGHSEAGFRILDRANMDGEVAEIVYQHHERCDGSGYPRGLSASEILPAAKIIMVADVVEAMMSHRPYRASLGWDAACAEIKRGRGIQYDADVCHAAGAVFALGFQFTS